MIYKKKKYLSKGLTLQMQLYLGRGPIMNVHSHGLFLHNFGQRDPGKKTPIFIIIIYWTFGHDCKCFIHECWVNKKLEVFNQQIRPVLLN